MAERGGSRTPGGAAQRGAGEPILSSDHDNSRAGALLALGKIGGTAHP